jgi:hypothetical protein
LPPCGNIRDYRNEGRTLAARVDAQAHMVADLNRQITGLDAARTIEPLATGNLRTATAINAQAAALAAAAIGLSHVDRAVVLKALLIHGARWPEDGARLIRDTIGPADSRKHTRQKDNIRRFFGYVTLDPDDAIACATDRATFWAAGLLPPEQAVFIDVPVPVWRSFTSARALRSRLRSSPYSRNCQTSTATPQSRGSPGGRPGLLAICAQS